MVVNERSPDAPRNKFDESLTDELTAAIRDTGPNPKKLFAEMIGLSEQSKPKIHEDAMDNYHRFFLSVASAVLEERGYQNIRTYLQRAHDALKERIGADLSFLTQEAETLKALETSSSNPFFSKLLDLSLDIFGGHIECLVAFLQYMEGDQSSLTEELIKNRFARISEKLEHHREKQHHDKFHARRIFGALCVVPVRIRGEVLHSDDNRHLLLDILGPEKMKGENPWRLGAHDVVAISKDKDHPKSKSIGDFCQLLIIGGAVELLREPWGRDAFPKRLDNARILSPNEEISWG
jgi:hypothetical protein